MTASLSYKHVSIDYEKIPELDPTKWNVRDLDYYQIIAPSPVVRGTSGYISEADYQGAYNQLPPYVSLTPPIYGDRAKKWATEKIHQANDSHRNLCKQQVYYDLRLTGSIHHMKSGRFAVIPLHSMRDQYFYDAKHQLTSFIDALALEIETENIPCSRSYEHINELACMSFSNNDYNNLRSIRSLITARIGSLAIMEVRGNKAKLCDIGKLGLI